MAFILTVQKFLYPKDDYHKIFQDRRPRSQLFPCIKDSKGVKWRSEHRPKSVHKLRPGDIDVIAAIGDSITCGNAARENNPLGIIIQDRGVSFTGGGIGTWHDVITLPNIIKNFNPNLTGYSIGRGDFYSHNAQLNVAVPAALDDDVLDQVKMFIKKMSYNRRINFKNDWKLLSIFIGHNDICSYQCFDRRKHSPAAHKLNLQKALDYLYQNVPRLFVNLIPLLDPTIAVRIPASSMVCNIFRRFACTCLFRFPSMKEGIVNLTAEVRRYQEAERELVFSGRYDGREDFTVEIQPFSLLLNAPMRMHDSENEKLTKLLTNGFPFWSPECFHFNQRGLALMSFALWNNMLEPVGNKSLRMEDYDNEDFKCPSEKYPYFFTKKNSKELT
ncbi:hypothetical protein J437_LFUL016035 [Ladona fulva]|uniref:Phospholipase B1, membrane-associated n=1 Tax=Ladona fulva TaxID=123851 RepID=A0A8K0KJF0_LADFU|nr:hypothetical protein J437_LFUL016035 [Ladona fulva]